MSLSVARSCQWRLLRELEEALVVARADLLNEHTRLQNRSGREVDRRGCGDVEDNQIPVTSTRGGRVRRVWLKVERHTAESHGRDSLAAGGAAGKAGLRILRIQAGQDELWIDRVNRAGAARPLCVSHRKCSGWVATPPLFWNQRVTVPPWPVAKGTLPRLIRLPAVLRESRT